MNSDKLEIVAKLWMNSDTSTLDDAIKLIGQKLPNCFSSLEADSEEQEEKALNVKFLSLYCLHSVYMKAKTKKP